MFSFKIYFIVRIVLILLVTIPALVIFGLLFRRPGYSHDNTRRWVDYTKIASGFWGSAQILRLLQQIIFTAYYDDIHGWLVFQARDASFAFGYISSMFEIWAVIAIFLALFYLAHALTQLRTEGQDDSSAYRKGRIVVLGVSGFLAVLNTVTWCLWLANSLSPSWDDNARIMYLVASCFTIVIAGLLVFCGIGSIVYSAKSRMKARGSPVQKAAQILVVCSSLYLVRAAWFMVIFFFGLYDFFGIIDVFLGCWISFVILALLYVLTIKEEYSLSKAHYRSKTVVNSQSA
ncbi:uncharacterized protein ColSpa_04851 [Colletotrichum spaethianum]|uniref:Uncharacterized protein n=1 Tax=Colletotrichum spaethianum TaxID=700344 RepID=A0AA37LDP0_9PEZI|nr:uncharacterized protein ColSpa_04851 [Colletotrichum spaethianum]GKT44670.1 hypothetical protein ColSpa_04851 [Colletotrichum spaethianum]